MKTINFIFGIHDHQPVGNFDFVIEDAYQQSYLPFVEIVEEFTSLHISFHFSGCLLEWLEKQHPDFIDRIAHLVKRGNVEIISGGFYEPILVMIPDKDKIGQIKMMNSYIKKKFSYNPKGLWLTERVWEPHLARTIAESGIKYVTVDDYHFLSTGKQEADLTGYFVTEEQGKKLSIFPINQKLRYAIPFKDPQETIDYLRQFATVDGDNVIIMADDGEKFGLWPGTHETVFTNNWLRKFFKALEENSDWIKTRTFSEFYDNHPPEGRIYLPTASYFEMSEWSLPWEAGEKFADLVQEFEDQDRLEEVKPFIKGGIWRNFLFKYDESNWMQKKVLYLSKRFHGIKKSGLSNIQRRNLKEARNHLWRGMCNCAYWHGIFGGLYLPHLRHAIYGELIRCEEILNDIENISERIPFGKDFHFEIIDFDADGENEVLITNKNIHVAFAPHRGAILEEFSLLDKGFNLLNTVKRYKEAYHRKVINAESEQSVESVGSIHDIVTSKEKGLDRYLKYDSYPRKSLVDHIINSSVTLDQFRNGEYYEDSDFINGRYNFKVDRISKGVTFSRDGWVNWQRFSIKKEFKITESSLFIIYKLMNLGDKKITFRFGPELNFAMLSGNSPDRYYVAKDRKLENTSLSSIGVESNLESLSVIDEYDGIKVTIKTKRPAEFWRFPVETVSLSESGFERVYQSSVVIPWTDMILQPQEEATLSFELEVE